MIVTLSNRHIGGIKFDATITEEHNSELSITENPIESGANIADHAVLMPKQVSITGVMVDYKDSSVVDDLNVPYVRESVDFLNKIPVAAKIVSHTNQTLAKANKIARQFKNINNLLNQPRKLAPWLPEFGLSDLLSDTESEYRVKQCYADLLMCQRSGEVIDIQTGIHLYQNMLIESISVKQDKDGYAEFTIAAREIFIVESKQISQRSTPAGKRKSGRAANQASDVVNQGNTQPKAEPENKSFINVTVEGVKKWPFIKFP